MRIVSLLLLHLFICFSSSQVSVSRTPLNSQIIQFVFSPTEPSRMLLVTAYGTLLFSNNFGTTWTNQASYINQYPVSVIIQSQNKLMILGSLGSFTVSDFSQSTIQYKAINMPNLIWGSFNPANSDQFLAKDRSGTLYATFDFGKTWSNIDKDVGTFSWGLASDLNSLYYIQRTTSQLRKYNINTNTTVALLAKCSQTQMAAGKLFVSPLNPGEPLWVSEDGVTFKMANYPLDKTLKALPILLEAQPSTVFLASKFSSAGGLAHLLKSDSSGLRYSLSLPYLQEQTGYFSFEKFNGLEGIYFANEVANPQEYGSGSRPVVRTLITFDNGGVWKYLNPPVEDEHQHTIVCTGGCRLHLHTMASYPNWGPVYTTSNAVGLAIATGNIGQSLSTEIAYVNTYFSRDAGLSWKQIKTGSSIYDIGDHGGIIVLADNTKETSEVMYTLDEGDTWNTFVFTSSKILVTNILSEERSTSKMFYLYGQEDSNAVIYTLDFRKIYNSTCKSTDYDLFTPKNADSCIMGRRVTYSRKKPSAACFNMDLDHTFSVQNCACTREDYECDFGYERTADGNCALIIPGSSRVPSPCTPGLSYNVSTGYRKIAGDSCDPENANFSAYDQETCPSTTAPTSAPPSPSSKSIAGYVVVIVIMIVVIIILIGLAVYYREKIKEVIPWFNRDNPIYNRIDINADSLYDDEELETADQHRL